MSFVVLFFIVAAGIAVGFAVIKLIWFAREYTAAARFWDGDA